jgi:cell division cycle 14
VRKGWYQFASFNVLEYEYYEKVEHGDMNWIIPGQFLALMGPVDPAPDSELRYGHAAKSYVPIFKHLNITKVIRLNEPHYDPIAFTSQGIEHEDNIFLDGSVPPPQVVDDFLTSCESHLRR